MSQQTSSQRLGHSDGHLDSVEEPQEWLTKLVVLTTAYKTKDSVVELDKYFPRMPGPTCRAYTFRLSEHSAEHAHRLVLRLDASTPDGNEPFVLAASDDRIKVFGNGWGPLSPGKVEGGPSIFPSTMSV